MPAARLWPRTDLYLRVTSRDSVPLSRGSKHAVPTLGTERRRTARATVPTRGRSPRTATTDCSGCRRAADARAAPSCKQVDFHFCSNSEECSKTPTDVRTAAQRDQGAIIPVPRAFARRRLSVRGNCLKHTRDPRDAVDVLSEPPAILQPRTGLPWSSGKLYSKTAPQG